jgi:hypothetical protein
MKRTPAWRLVNGAAVPGGDITEIDTSAFEVQQIAPGDGLPLDDQAIRDVLNDEEDRPASANVLGRGFDSGQLFMPFRDVRAATLCRAVIDSPDMDLKDATLMILIESAAHPSVAKIAQAAYDQLASGQEVDYRVLDELVGEASGKGVLRAIGQKYGATAHEAIFTPILREIDREKPVPPRRRPG